MLAPTVRTTRRSCSSGPRSWERRSGRNLIHGPNAWSTPCRTWVAVIPSSSRATPKHTERGTGKIQGPPGSNRKSAGGGADELKESAEKVGAACRRNRRAMSEMHGCRAAAPDESKYKSSTQTNTLLSVNSVLQATRGRTSFGDLRQTASASVRIASTTAFQMSGERAPCHAPRAKWKSEPAC